MLTPIEACLYNTVLHLREKSAPRVKPWHFFDLVNWSETTVMAQMVKNLPAVQEIQVQSLGQEDPLEKGMATHSSFLAWRIPKTNESGRLQRAGHD